MSGSVFGWVLRVKQHAHANPPKKKCRNLIVALPPYRRPTSLRRVCGGLEVQINDSAKSYLAFFVRKIKMKVFFWFMKNDYETLKFNMKPQTC